MQLIQPTPVSAKRNKRLKSGRTPKKHKRLDAICEKVYNENHCIDLESNGHSAGMDPSFFHPKLRRSSRVRREPNMLDSSPPPSKRRKSLAKIENESVSPGRNSDDLSSVGHSPGSTSMSAEASGRWKSRLRSRVTNRGFKVDNQASPCGKKKLWKDVVELHKNVSNRGNGVGDNREVVAIGVPPPTVVKSKRSVVVRADHIKMGCAKKTYFGDHIAHVGDVMTRSQKLAKSCISEHTSSGPTNFCNTEESPKHSPIGNCDGLLLNNFKSNSLCLSRVSSKETVGRHVEDGFDGNGNLDTVGISVRETKNFNLSTEKGKDADTARYLHDKVQQNNSKTENGIFCGHTKGCVEENNYQEGKFSHPFLDKLNNLQIFEGRRCGLCGTGTDGKPPKIVTPERNESENEACSGSSASEESNYDIWDGFGDEPDWVGRLLGPVNDRFGIAGIWVHQNCAVWSPEVYFPRQGCLKNIKAALFRGRLLKCSRCTRPGATIGCREDRCPKTYHLPCARADGCHFDHRKFLIACSDHRHLFQPHGSQNLKLIKKMKATKTKNEMRKMSNNAWRKDIDDEEKWFENCGEDEEFLKREGKRLHRDLARIEPVYIGGSNAETDVQFHGWESVAGLQNVIHCMKEVVTLPLLYPQFLNSLGLNPPRGVLLHGPPGTGKTLVVRALIGSCARGDRRIAYFARKGADCLGKYVGDAERQLRLLFQVAERAQPSIIFFDEIDGLAPRRSAHQDQTQSSVVSTLLALLDGLKPRGSVVVIGATNRPDALDPALRRPGRFDREIYFPLPSVKDRDAILSLYTQKWPNPVSVDLINKIARKTSGFAGADLKALCAQVAMAALKRNHPMDDLLSHSGKNKTGMRPSIPTFLVKEKDWFEALADAPPPCCHREAGIALSNVMSSPLPLHLIPCLLHPLSLLMAALSFDERLRLPKSLLKIATYIKSRVCAYMEKKKASNTHWPLHIYDMLQEDENALKITNIISCQGNSTEEADASDFGNIKPFCSSRDGLFLNQSPSLRKGSAFRILISGSARSGQRHIASFILHHLSGNISIQRVDLATMSHEGLDDVSHGVFQILMRCTSSGSSLLLFMPRIDLWAVENSHPDDDTDSSYSTSESDPSCLRSSSHGAVSPTLSTKASLLWSMFIEQIASFASTMPLFILATSEVRHTDLPQRVKRFFRSDMVDLTSSPPPSPDAVPGFILDVTGSFDHDTFMDLAATKLTRDMVRLFVELVHVETASTPKSESRGGQAADDRESVADDDDDDEVVVEAGCLQLNRPLRGKSRLECAISAFGYQVLRYPHFAYLCWVTSKLKDGPSADIDGHLKRWPFNSCIVRPAGFKDAAKGRTNFSLVHGLAAIGLSAYRGVYASLMDVSSEVREVLRLLVCCIDTKIRSGKSWHRYSHMLSQVACLEDAVNGWVYTLQSLDHDSEEAKPGCKGGQAEGDAPVVCRRDADGRDEGVGMSSRTSHVMAGVQKSTVGERPCSGTAAETRDVLMRKAASSGGRLSSSDGEGREGAEGCTYSCCGECFVALRGLVLRLVVEEWKGGGSCRSVDDAHDTVESVGVGLLSGVRRLCGSRSDVVGEGDGESGCRVYSHRRKNWCRCSCSEKATVGPRECWCHSGKRGSCGNPFENLQLVVRNGFAVVAGECSEDGVRLSCAFLVFCLCSLVESVSSRWRNRPDS